MSRDNQRAVFAAQMEASTERWEVKHHVHNKEGETQSVGYTILDHKPTDDDIREVREEVLSQNVWTTHVVITTAQST